MQFRHIFLAPGARALLDELVQRASADPALLVRDTLAHGHLVFHPPLRGDYRPQDLVSLATHDLAALRRERGDWRVAATALGRDYAADTIPG